MAEMGRYATDLRSMTQGRGSFTLNFERYEEAPANVAQKVMEESKNNRITNRDKPGIPPFE